MLLKLLFMLLIRAAKGTSAYAASGESGQGHVEVDSSGRLAAGGQSPIPKLRNIPGTAVNASAAVLSGEVTLVTRLQAALRELPHVVSHLMPAARLVICEAAGHWQTGTSRSVLQEIKRTEPLPGDPYRSSRPAEKVPTWHGWVALRLPEQCRECEQVVEVVSEYAQKSFHDHELRMCASFAFVSDDASSESDKSVYAAPAGPLVGSPPEPILVWLPPVHEVHNVHERPVIFNGPWTTVEIARFVNNRCTRASRIGRAFVGDAFASQFARATTVRKQKEVLNGLRKLQWQYREARSQQLVQQRLRYYEDIMHAAITEGMVAPDHFTKLSQRLEQQLQMEVYKDALAEVSLIRHNVVQAFLESSGDPTVVHNMIQMDVIASAKKDAEAKETST